MAVADLLVSWAATLNRLPPGDAATAAAALGLTGSLVPQFNQYAVEPPPAGLSELTVDERGGDVFSLSAVPAPGTLTRADLDALLGPGHQVPRVHWNNPVPIAYRVELPGEPYTCTVFAYFTSIDGPTDPVVSVLLRRDRSTTA